MYERSATVYDAFNDASGKDYAAESSRLLVELKRRAPHASTLLDVACGTGRHLAHLRSRFEVVGIDDDTAMLDIARRNLPDVTLHAGDMRDFELDRRFDVVTCLFSAIGYMHEPEDLSAAVRTMAEHLSPGGVLVIEPWIQPDRWIVGHVEALAVDGGATAITRVARSSRRGHLSRIDFHFAVATADGIDAFDEPHELALWAVEDYLAAFAAAGLEVEHDPVGLTGRGLFVGQTR